MANIAALKLRAAEALNDILRTPVCLDVGTQTDDNTEEDIVSVLKKRKNEVLFLVDKMLRGEPPASPRVEQDNSSCGNTATDCSDESDIESVDSIPTEKPSPDGATISTDATGHRTNVSQRRKMKLMKELARQQGVEYEEERQLHELYNGLSEEDILNQLEDDKQPRMIHGRVDFVPLMDLPSITKEQYRSISRDGQMKYVAAVVNRMRELAAIHGTPHSMRAVCAHYNLNYDTFYDAWRKRTTKNPYLV